MISKHKEQLDLRLEKMQGDMFMQNKNVVSLNSYVANYLIFTIILYTLLADLHAIIMKNFPSLSLLTSSLSPLKPYSLSSGQSKYQKMSLKASPPKYGSCSGCQPCPSCHPPVVSNVDNNTFTAYSNFYTHTQNM